MIVEPSCEVRERVAVLLKYENVPPTATLPELAPACEKAKFMIASSALMFSPDCCAAVELDAVLDDRVRRVVEELEEDRAADAALARRASGVRLYSVSNSASSQRRRSRSPAAASSSSRLGVSWNPNTPVTFMNCM